MTSSTPPRWIGLLHTLLVVGGCALLLVLLRMASAPVLALLRQSAIEPVGVAAYWITGGAVLIGAPLAGWWADTAGRPTALVVGVGFVAASLALMPWLREQAWVVLYSLLTFGVVLTGLAATTTLAVLARRVALALVLAFGLPFVRVTPALPAGMRPLLGMGERAFVVLALGLIIVAALPLLALALARAIGRRQHLDESGADRVPAGTGGTGRAPARPGDVPVVPALAIVATAGWLGQVGAAMVDVNRTLPAMEGQVIWSFVILTGSGLAGYVWALASDVTTHPTWSARGALPPAIFVAATLGVFAAGAILMTVASGRPLLNAGLFVAGFGLGGVVPLATAAVLRGTSPLRWSLALGIAVAAFAFGQTAGARLNVYLAAWFGAPGPIALSALVAGAAAWWVLATMRRRPGTGADSTGPATITAGR
ncbi:MAG: hypothetical protein R2752_19575 [Vicinamibacterales bacterium]